MAKRTCVIEGCEKPRGNGRLCWSHYNRKRRYGSTDIKRLTCGQCDSAFDRPIQTGPVPRHCSAACKAQATLEKILATRKPGNEGGKCPGCGGVVPITHGGRALKFCTPNCRHLHAVHKGKRPTLRTCISCTNQIDLTVRLADGRLRYPAYIVRCDACMAKRRPHRYGMTTQDVADRDGADCRWCGEPVDFALVGTASKWAPSVDHLIPWSRGGTNDPDNLQLLHRVCNARKGARLPA